MWSNPISYFLLTSIFCENKKKKNEIEKYLFVTCMIHRRDEMYCRRRLRDTKIVRCWHEMLFDNKCALINRLNTCVPVISDNRFYAIYNIVMNVITMCEIKLCTIDLQSNRCQYTSHVWVNVCKCTRVVWPKRENECCAWFVSIVTRFFSLFLLLAFLMTRWSTVKLCYALNCRRGGESGVKMATLKRLCVYNGLCTVIK